MSLEEDVRRLMSPTDEDGKLNVLYADIYFKRSLEDRYGKEAVDKECDRFNQHTQLVSFDHKPKKRSDKEEVEALKSRVRRLEKDVKWLKKTLRELAGLDNSTDGE